MNITPVGFEHTIARRLCQEYREAFIEEFDSLLAKHDTSDVWRQFAIWMLVDPEHGVIRFVGSSSIQHAAIRCVSELFIYDCKDAAEWKAAASAAAEAAEAAEAEADAALNNDNDSHWEDWKAAEAEADAALTAAYLAEDVACGRTGFDIVSSAAEEAAEAAGKYYYTFSDAYSSPRAAVEAHRETMADKLIEIVKKAPVLPRVCIQDNENRILTRIIDYLDERVFNNNYEKMKEDKRLEFITELSRVFREEFNSLLAQHDTSDVWRQFVIWMLIDPEHGVIKFTKPGTDAHDVIQRVAQLYIDDCKDVELWEAAVHAALYNVDYPHFSDPAFIDEWKDVTDSYPYYRNALKNAASSAMHAAVAAIYNVDYINPADAVEDAVYVFDRTAAFDGRVRKMAEKLLELIKAAPER